MRRDVWLAFVDEIGKIAGVPSEQTPRPEVAGLKQPRLATPRLNPEVGSKVPSNPFRGNWQKLAAPADESATPPPAGKGRRALDATAGAAEVGLSRPLGLAGAERLLGAQSFVHGTSNQAAESILRNGLDPSYGGGPTGGAAAIENPAFMANAAGKVHVAHNTSSGRLTARAHAALAEAHAAARARGARLGPEEAAMHYVAGMIPGMGGGKVLHGVMPFDEFKRRFEVDPDLPSAGFRSGEAVGAEALGVGRAGLRRLWNARSSGLLNYARENPGRFLTGAGGVGLGALALADGVHRLYRAVRPAQGLAPSTKVAQGDDLALLGHLGVGAATLGAGAYAAKRVGDQVVNPSPAGVGAGAGARTAQRVLLPWTVREQAG